MSTDSTINFLLENGWEIDRNNGTAWHWKHTEYEPVPLDAAMNLQEEFDPESIREFKMLNNLNSKYAHMYNEYLDS